ncbi:MAG: hypothetical protein ABR879_06785 [Methanomassiliicoccales archaeon]
MAIGERLYEEKGKVTMGFIKEIDANGLEMLQSFNTEVKGFDRMPSGTNMASGKIMLMPNGMAHGKWHGMIMTVDGDMIVWAGNGRSKRSPSGINGVMLITYMTMSEKLKWLNDVIGIADISGDMMQVSITVSEWK